MTDIDLMKLSLGELKALQKAVDKAIKSFEDRRRKEALEAVQAAARESGYSLAELTGGATKKPGKRRPAKYRHPENPELTWSGRGRRPKWYKELIEAGTAEEDLRV